MHTVGRLLPCSLRLRRQKLTKRFSFAVCPGHRRRHGDPPSSSRLARSVSDRRQRSKSTTRSRRSGLPEEQLASVVREVLKISIDEQMSWGQSDLYASFRGWREAVERAGVLVMQDGNAEVDEMRGFASVDPRAAPAILVNNHDNPRARAFTLIHELGHVIRASLGLETGLTTETWCEAFAGEVLMPADAFVETFAEAHANSALDVIRYVARRFGVSLAAAAVRAGRLGSLSSSDVSQIVGLSRRYREQEDESSRGGDFYKNQVAKFGPAYLRLVFSALDSEAVTLPAATNLLDGVKVKRFERLRDELSRR
jgi:Zn-dependent peptidase ImmA (M78 family)